MKSGSPFLAEMRRTTSSLRPLGTTSASISVTKPCRYGRFSNVSSVVLMIDVGPLSKGSYLTPSVQPRRRFQRLHVGLSHLLPGDKPRQTDRCQIAVYNAVQLVPQLVRHASLAVVAVELAVTAGRIDRLVYRPDDFGHGNVVGQSGQAIPPP